MTARKKRSNAAPPPTRGRAPRLTKKQLADLVSEATVDCYGLEEQLNGFFNMLEEHLDLPFETEVLGMNVTVESIDLSDDLTIGAICRRGKHRQRLSLLDLPRPSPLPAGWQWIEAYRHWTRNCL